MSATKIAELELELKLTDNEVSKSITQVLNTLAKKVENASSSASKNFKETSKTMKETAKKVTEKVNEQVTEQVKKTNEQVREKVTETTQNLNPQIEAVKAKVSETLAEIQSKIKPVITNISEEIRQSLSDVSNSILKSKAELLSINSLLDFDPSNTELLAQKQEVLSQSVEQARQKLQALKATKDTVYADFATGKIGKDDFRDYKRQIILAEQELKQAEKELVDFEKISEKSSEEVCSDFKDIKNEVKKSNSVFSNSFKSFKNTANNNLSSVSKASEKTRNSVSSSFSKLGSAVVAAFSVAAVKKFGQQCIESAAEVNAANSQFEQTFCSMQSQAESAIATVSKNSGILKTRLQGVGTSIYAFAKTTGMDSADALNMMQEALQVTADSAAYYDRSLEDTAESLKSFLKGNFENDAALGLSCTETTRNAAANKLYGKSFTDLSESQKQLTLLQMVKDANQLSGAMGQASREADGWENVTGNLKESWNQLLAVIGKPILQVATNIVQKLSSAIAKLTEYAKGAINALSKLFNWGGDDTANSISAAASSAENLSSEAESSSNSLESVADSAEKAKNSVAGFDKLNVITKSDSGGSDTSASSTSASNGTSVANTVVKDTNSGVSGAFKNLYEKSGFKGFVENVQKGINKVDWSSIGKNCESIFKNSVPIAQNYLTQVQKVGKSAFGAVGSFVGGVVQVSGKQLQTLTGGVAKWLDKDKNKINGFIATIGDNFSKGYDNLSTFFEKGFDVIGQSVDRVRPQMEDAISNLLSGFTDFGGAVGTIFSEGFSLATESLVKWIDNDGATIGEFFDNIQLQMADVMNFVGGVFSDIGNFLLGWWDGEGGSEIFQNVCDMFLNIGTTLMNVYNDWIMPAWNFIVGVFQSAWTDCLKPIFEQLWTVFGKVCDYIATIWNNWLLPFVNFISDTLGPVFNTVLRNIQSIFETVFRVIGDVVGGILKSFGGLIDFITGVFSGNWKKAWNGIKDFFGGIWDGIWGIIKGFVNLIIDGINLLLTGIYTVVAAIVNTIGGIADAIGSIFGQEWGWSMPNEPVLIPHLATGGLVKAPTLAVVGDNAGANSGNPEVIAPLSKLQGMINTSNGEDTVILGEILSYLKKLYEMFVIFRNNGGNYYQFVAEINGNDIFNEIVKQNELYKNRHNGKSAFA